MKKIKHIIIQAGGKGSRLMRLTENKPKALVSVNGEPLLFRVLNQYPDAEFFIICDYKKDLLINYLKTFCHANYTIIEAVGTGTNSGIAAALKKIPENEPILITWCDLYFKKPIAFEEMEIGKKNYLGLSKKFSCRWSFKNNELVEERSSTSGVAGIYIFKNKLKISDIPRDGEFCRYLKDKKIIFDKFFLNQAAEIGTLADYENFTKKLSNTRPFNKMIMKKDRVIKYPITAQGEEIATFERGWYEWAKKFNWNFIPKVYKNSPLVLQRIHGESLFKYQLQKNEKEIILEEIISSIKKIHSSEKTDNQNHEENDHESIIGKTKKRLDSISHLIPNINNDFFYINELKCVNFYKHWDKVEQLCAPLIKNNHYSPIHGDITFSNIILEESTRKPFFIDPRGYYGKSIIFGDPDYDWAKVYYSIAGNYDQFNRKNFNLKIDSENVQLSIDSSGWEDFSELYLKKIARDPNKIKIYHAIIWLSLTSYAWDDYDSICGAFYNGIKLMQKIYEETF